MTELLAHLRRLPVFMLAVVLLLCTVGVMCMDPAHASKQLVWIGVGVAALVVTMLVPYRWLGESSYVIFAVSLALLVAVFVLPESISPNIKGARRWIRLPGLEEVNCQPSEIAKFAYILMLAWYLRFRTSYRSLRGLLVPFALTLAPLALVLKEPDLGTSLLFLPTLFAMLFLAGAKAKHLLTILGLGFGVMAAVVLVQLYLPGLSPLEHHQEQRIRAWLRQGQYDPGDQRAKDEGFHIRQSLLAIGSGGLSGRGPTDRILEYNPLPEDDTDFIFALIGHRWGFVGCALILAAYLVIFAAGVDIAGSTADPFGRLLAIGVVALFAAQMLINTGMTIGLLPVTGMTLPFVSYGGSSLVVNFAAMGLLINVSQHRPIVLYRRRFEWRDDAEELT